MNVSGKICNEQVNWKIDTGAKRTFITLDTFKSIQYRYSLELKPTKCRFKAANGNKVFCDGVAFVVLNFKDTDIFFPVIVGGVTENLLGEDFLEKFQCNLNYTNRELLIHLDNDIVNKGHISNEGKLSQVCTMETCNISAGCEILVESKIKGEVKERHGILVQDDKVENHNMLVARVLIDCEDSFQARILNP
jgi:hypothetical protein